MNDNFSNSVKKKKLNKQKIIGISVERSCYEPNKKKLQSFLKADQLEKVKEKIKEKIKEKKV
jgi:predicted enzyme related to lactoylglutathione lyase